MNNYKKLLFCILSTLCLFTLFGFEEQELRDLTYDEQEEIVNKVNGDTNMDSDWLDEYLIQINSIKDVDLSDFLDNPKLNAEENETIKSIILDIILYIYGFDVDILSALDNEASEDCFAQYEFYDKGWTILDEINAFRGGDSNKEVMLNSVYANFMLHFDCSDENEFGATVPLYDSERRHTFYLTFQRINGEFRVVWIGLG